MTIVQIRIHNVGQSKCVLIAVGHVQIAQRTVHCRRYKCYELSGLPGHIIDCHLPGRVLTVAVLLGYQVDVINE